MAYPAAYYKQIEIEGDVLSLTQRVYRDKTEQSQGRMKILWFRYCKYVDKAEPLEALKELPIKVLISFFRWMMNEFKIGSTSTLQTYWNTFCCMRKNETGCLSLDIQTKAQMQGVREQLALEYSLEREKKKKPIMRAEDEFELLKTLYLSIEMDFDHERHRLKLALIMQLAGITGNRPSALLAVCYGHIKITLLRDPDGGEVPRLLIEIAYKYTKGYLGAKDTNEFGIPDVPNEPCLLLCHQVILLALIFADQAFATSELASPEQLFRLKIPPGQQQLSIPLRQQLDNTPVFRRSEHTVYGVRISTQEPLSDSCLRSRLLKLVRITGMELPTGPYTFWRGTGEALDASSFISESQRNLILQHGYNSNTFQKNYLSRYITTDTQAAYRGLKPQNALMRAASGMSRTIDRRRPWKLTAAQKADVDRHPEVKLLRRRQQMMRKQIKERFGPVTKLKGTSIYEQYQKAYHAHRNTKRQQEERLLKEIKAKYRGSSPSLILNRNSKGYRTLMSQKRTEATLSKSVTASSMRFSPLPRIL